MTCSKCGGSQLLADLDDATSCLNCGAVMYPVRPTPHFAKWARRQKDENDDDDE